MKILAHQGLINSIESSVMSTEAWSRQDLDAIVRVGEPSVDIGGKFYKCRHCDSNDSAPDVHEEADEYSETEEYFTIPSAYRKVRSEFPVLMDFSKEYFSDPHEASRIWSEEMARRITLKVLELRCAGTMSGSSTQVYEV